MIKQLIRLARPQQWVKNGILLISLVFSGELSNLGKVEISIFATAMFCLLSSSAYTINDMVDKEKDLTALLVWDTLTMMISIKNI